MKIVGINSSHDTSVCQYDTETQTLEFMYEEDRFRRKKYWSPVAKSSDDQHHDVLSAIYKGGVQRPDELVFASFDRRAFNIDWDVDKLLENRMTSIEIAEWIASAPLNNEREQELVKKYSDYILDSGVGGIIEEKQIHDGFASQFEVDGEPMHSYYFWYEHHLFHAYCGYYLSPYYENGEDCIAITMDGGGARLDWENWRSYQEIESIYRMKKGEFAERQWVLSSNHRALGNLHNSGFPNQQHGSMDYEGENVIEVKNGVEYEYTSRPSNGMDFSNLSHALGCDKLGRAAGKVMGMASYGIATEPPKRNFNNFAYAQELELHAFDNTCKTIQKAIDLNPDCKNIVLSGGYALNCTNNYKYLSAFPDHQFFVDPIPHDGGTAFGACVHLDLLFKNKDIVSKKNDNNENT